MYIVTCMSTPQNIYDDPEFFARYDRMRIESSDRNELFEQALIRSLLPDVRGLRVLDMGCGAGEMCRWLTASGAASVTGIDVSERMLAIAKSYKRTGITYVQSAAENAVFEPQSFDLVVSSYLLNYIKDITPVFEKIREWLRPGGMHVFLMEHPVVTAPHKRRRDEPWITDSSGASKAWKLAHYADEGKRISHWFVDDVVMYHRTMATVVNSLVDAGFSVTRMLEPHATEEVERDRPYLTDERIRPTILLISAEALSRQMN